jgi:hypothetical protein
MSRTRDLIQEIIDVRNRRRSEAMRETFLRLSELNSSFESRQALSPELLKYFPVGLVACLEGFFRLAIKQLVDSGGAHLDNAEKLFANIKIDYHTLKALHGREITIGDLVAHQVPINRLENIQSHLSALLGKDFLKELRSVKEAYWGDEEGEPPPILAEPDATFASVTSTFELRHIICHELATKFEVSLAEVERCVFGTVLFLKAAVEYLEEVLHPGVRWMSHVEMKAVAAAELKGLLQEIERLNQRLVAEFQKQDQENIGTLAAKNLTEGFIESAEAWRHYMESWATIDADSSYGTGTGWGLGYSERASQLARERIAELTRLLKEQTLFDTAPAGQV